MRLSTILSASILIDLNIGYCAEVTKSVTNDSYGIVRVSCTFICDGTTVDLPSKTSVGSILHNKDKDIWAINFHETSNYNGAELAICTENEPLVISDIYNQVKAQLYMQKIIPRVNWDRCTLQVLKIENNVIYVSFAGVCVKEEQTIEKAFRLYFNPASKMLEVTEKT